jgi:adenosylcobinamide-GDP ribazoletransferase
MRATGIDPSSLLRDVTACIGFYTRIPIPGEIALPAHFADAQWAAPVAGLVVGAAGGCAMALSLWAGLPATVAAALALATTMLVTGALHEDGAADVADGFGGGRTRESKLEIMRDSRIGTYGVCALVLSILTRWSALAALAGAGMWPAVFALVGAQVAARAPIAAFMHLVAPARSDGLSAGVGRPGQPSAIAALVIGLLALLPGGLSFTIVATILLAIWFAVLKRLCERQIGGQTGDVLGALEQGGEVAVLCAACIFLL